MTLSIRTALSCAALVLLPASQILAAEAGDWIIRFGAAQVAPDESSSLISTAATGALPGTAASVDDDTQLGITVAYRITDRVGVELLAATPFKHDIGVKGLGGYGYDVSDLGSTEQLPPTLVLQYYFPNDSKIEPYVGLGINYTAFFSEDLSNSAKTTLGADNLELDDSFGIALQAGADWSLNEHWVVNASVWFIDIDTDAELDSALGKVKADVEIDPMVYMLGLGYRF